MTHPADPAAGLAAAVGAPVRDAARRTALLDARGALFQRLEWYGDAVLDALLAEHALTTGCCSSAQAQGLAADRALTARAVTAGLPGLLTWEASPQRLADLVEACVGAAALEGGLDGARAAAARLVHEGLALPAQQRAAGTTSCAAAGPFRAAAAAGAGVLELAVSAALLSRLPDADEGELSRARGQLLRGGRLAALPQVRRQAQQACPRGRGDVEHVVDHLQAVVADVVRSEGLAAAVAAGSRLVEPEEVR